MNIGLIAVLLFLAFFIVLFLGTPIAFSLMGIGLLFSLIFLGPQQIVGAFLSSFSVMTNEIFMAGPLFVFMATVLQSSGIAEDLFDVIYKWSGGLRGGLAIGVIIMCALIAAMTGLGATAVIMMGLTALPEMRKHGYHDSISVGCIPAGGTLGPLIPPSILMIIIGGLSLTSIGKLFLSGILPGILVTFLFCAYVLIRCYINPSLAPALPPEERATWKEKFISAKGLILPFLLIIGVLGSIYSGAATATEASAVGAFGALIVAIIHRRLTWSSLKKSLFASMSIINMVMWILIGGSILSSFISAVGAARLMKELLLSLPTSPHVVIALMLIINLILGMFMDGSAITVICIPLFVPVVAALGFDLIWFGCLFTIALVIGYISPPFGFNLFFMKGIAPKDVTMGDIYRYSIPFCLIEVLALAICFLYPKIVLLIPSWM